MEDPFDPYLQWLDISLEEAQRPPDHYCLLGLQRFESDRQAIARAADVRMAKIRRIRPGGHLREWGRLLDQLGAAKICLSDPASKRAYDASLTSLSSQPAAETAPATLPYLPPATTSAPTPLTTTPLTAPIEPPPQQQSDIAGSAAPQRSAAETSAAPSPRQYGPTTRRVTPATALAIGVLTLLAVGLGGTFYYVVNRPPQLASVQGPVSDRTDRASPPTSPDAADPPNPPQPPASSPAKGPSPAQPPPVQRPPQPAASPGPGDTPQPKPEPSSEPPPPVDPKPQWDAAKQAAFARAAADVRASMSRRDLPAARRYLEAARQNCQTPAEQARLARLGTMLDYLDEFFDGIRDGVATLAAGQELVIEDKRLAVVEADRKGLMVKAAGRLRSWPIERLPTSIVMAIARETFADDAVTRLYLGTFLAVDAKGDPDRARTLWQEAARMGANVEELMPELEAADAGHSGARIEKTPPPIGEARLKQAEQSVRQTFKSQFEQATTNLKKQELAREMLARATAAGNDPAARFVMLREARDLAIAAGKATLASEAVDRMAGSYAIDTIALKAAALEKIAKTARGQTSGGHREIATASLSLFEQAIAAGRADEAVRMAAVAVASARKSGSRTLLHQAMSAKERAAALPGPQ